MMHCQLTKVSECTAMKIIAKKLNMITFGGQ